MLIGKYSFCGTCGNIKQDGPMSDCVKCMEEIKERMRIEFDEEMEEMTDNVY